MVLCAGAAGLAGSCAGLVCDIRNRIELDGAVFVIHQRILTCLPQAEGLRLRTSARLEYDELVSFGCVV